MNTLKLQTMADNLANGNLKEARKQARRFRQSDIVDYLAGEYCWTNEKALRAALWLKTGEDYQAYCDAR